MTKALGSEGYARVGETTQDRSVWMLTPWERQAKRGWAFTRARRIDKAVLELFNGGEPPPWIAQLFTTLRSGGPQGQWGTLPDVDFVEVMLWVAVDPAVRVPAVETAYITASTQGGLREERGAHVVLELVRKTG